MKNLILYGAGKNAVKEIEKVRKDGYLPICFCDADATKQGSVYLGLPVRSLAEVKVKYRDFFLWVTLADENKYDVFDYLIHQGIQRDQIVNYEVNKLLEKVKLDFEEYKNPSRLELEQIREELIVNGYNVVDYNIKPDDYHGFKKQFLFGADFYGGSEELFEEKVLEHFVAGDLLGLNKDMSYIDIAANESPWAYLLSKQGYKAMAIDLNGSKRFEGEPNYLVMDATNTTFQDNSIDAVSLQCAYECFIGTHDTNLIAELARILKPGGKAIILPLYMHTHYCGYATMDYCYESGFHDEGAKLYYNRKWKNIPFSRKYNITELERRVLGHARKHGLEYTIYRVTNGTKIHPDVYLYFVLELRKNF
ncbi:methyltransferase domain-containing protein [Anaerospora sp.]|uniref:methyltransferase domain-containing protein n=1 Tax=Anaerospora sp. TaxID=1960278 RepID=UPI0028981DF6|nr:methyltransferase domain-containing protein [Anaerospora sp.]